MGIFNRIQTEIEARDKKEEGITPSDLLDLPPQLSRLMNRITREGEMTVEEAAEHLQESAENARQMLDTLVEKGYLDREERDVGWIYRTRFGRRAGIQLPVGIWSALGHRTKQQEEASEGDAAKTEDAEDEGDSEDS